MANKVILEMKEITKRFPGVLALDKVSLCAYTGEIHALCGENGAGKSTLMKILSGSYPEGAYEGEIYVDGQRMHFKTPGDSEAAGIGMIYQEISMHLDMSVAENLFLGRWPLKKNRSVDWKKLYVDTREYMEMVGLNDVQPDTILRLLSASQQQLVSIARALSKHPKILVLDEPTSPLTNREADKLFEILHSLRDRGIACILITHKMDEVFMHADRVSVIRDGKAISSHLLSETSSNQIIKDMVGREIKNLYPKESVEIGDVLMEIQDFSVPHPTIPHRKIIDNVSFQLRKGEILGIAGLVGAGRSELVNAIFGKDRKLAGKVLVNGVECNIRTPKDAMKYGIGLVTEDRKADGILAGMSIAQNITVPNLDKVSRRGIMDLKKEKAFSQKFFDALSIKAPSLDTLMQQLSGGNQQKVVFAKWIAQSPKILILDEPTRGIDVSAKYEIYKIMVELARQGIGIIMISSELPELLSMADRVMVISNNRISGILDHNEFSQERVMELSAL